MFGWIDPDSFSRDPWGYAGNQCGHAVIGIGAGLAVLWLGVAWLWAAPVGSVAYWLLIERGQVRRIPAMFWDSLEDTAFVWAGAAIIAAPGLVDQTVAFAVGAALLALGVWRRA